jgi:hypothetical protein
MKNKPRISSNALPERSETLEICKKEKIFQPAIVGEIIVAVNGGTDGSQGLQQSGATVVLKKKDMAARLWAESRQHRANT